MTNSPGGGQGGDRRQSTERPHVEHLSTEGLLAGTGTRPAACAVRAQPCVTLACAPVRITALTSELGLCLELDDQAAVVADVDADDLQAGREHAVRLDPCKDSATGSPPRHTPPSAGPCQPHKPLGDLQKAGFSWDHPPVSLPLSTGYPHTSFIIHWRPKAPASIKEGNIPSSPLPQDSGGRAGTKGKT